MVKQVYDGNTKWHGGVNVSEIVVGRVTAIRCLVSQRDDCSLAPFGLVWVESSWFEPGRQVVGRLTFLRPPPNVCGAPVWRLLANRIWRCLLDWGGFLLAPALKYV